MFNLSAKAMFGISLTLISLVLAGVASYLNVRGAEGKIERRFVFGACAATWLIVAISMGFVLALPHPYHYIPLGLLIIVFPAIIYRFSLRHQLIREMERRKSMSEKNLET